MKRAALALVALGLLALVGLEAWLRARGWHGRTPPVPFERLARTKLAGVSEFVYHPRRFYTLAPHQRASAAHLGRYATGAWPFRGRPPEPAPPGLLRVAVVGDSSMYGFGVPTSQCVPSLLQEHLARAERGPEQVAVLNFGVSGYTSVQVDLCLAEVLERWRPDAVVIGCAGWNDQGPSLGVDDVEMLVRPPPAPWRALVPALASWLEAQDAHEIELPAVSSEELNRAWERGQPLFGTKVPADYVPIAIARMIERCREARVPVVVVVPAHPAETLREHPRTAIDADSVRRAALAAAAPIVDAPALFAAAGLSDARLHLDFGHPTPEGNELVARALAEHLGALLPAPRAPPSTLAILAWEPRRASVLGDVDVALSVSGLPPGETPVVLVGNAPLLDLVRLDEQRLVGRLMANGEGAQSLVLQSSAGCAVVREALLLERPWLEALPSGSRGGGPPAVRVHARPGDAVQLFWSDARRAEPLWWEAGRVWLAGTPRPPLFPEQPCDAQGVLVVALPEAARGLAEVWVQARVGPRDAGPWERLSVASEPLRLAGE